MSRPNEDELLALLRRVLSDVPPDVRVGVGDDAAIVERGSGLAALTADMLVEGVHFRLESALARDIGYKAIAVNVSDLAAMGASPRHGLVSLGLPEATSEGWIVELYGGMREAAGEYALSLVGGDLTRASQVVISVALSGEVAPGCVVTRAGARPGDAIVVTGELGAAAGGLVLSERPAIGAAVRSAAARELVRAHDRPSARVGEGQVIARAGASAMLDVSDGLALDLSRLCRASGVGAVVRVADVPVARSLEETADELGVQALDLALGGGEDYELLATISPSAAGPLAARLAETFGTPLTVIGEIRADPNLVAVLPDGTERPLEASGWDHFA